MNYHCRICHRPLTNRESIARGIGPICSLDYGRQMDMFAGPDYEHAMHEVGGKAVLCITDLDNGMSVTNGVEKVLAALTAQYDTLPRLVIYRDTAGVWDRIILTGDGKFGGFATIARGSRPKTLDDALQLLLEMENNQ